MTDLNPSDVLSDTPMREDRRKTVYDKRPGDISWASDRANFSGCRVITFTGGETTPPFRAQGLQTDDLARFDEQLDTFIKGLENGERVYAEDVANLYFSHRANLLVLYMKADPSSDSITFIITSQLDDADLEEFMEVQRRVNLEMREWREERDSRQAAEQEKLQAERKLIEIGRKAETYNLFEKLRKLEEENAALKKKDRDAS